MPFRELSNKITTSNCLKYLFHYSHFCLHIIAIFLSTYNNVLDSKSLYLSSVTLSTTNNFYDNKFMFCNEDTQLLYPFLQLVVEHKISGVPNVQTDGTEPSWQILCMIDHRKYMYQQLKLKWRIFIWWLCWGQWTLLYLWSGSCL
jgi:hypothetical protein